MPTKDPAEIIAEVRSLRGEVELRIMRILELSDVMYTSVRRGDFRQERERIESDIRLLEARLDRAMRQEEPQDPEARRRFLEGRQQLQSAIDGATLKLAQHLEVVPVYTAFSNTWKRFAGTMYQGLRRTASVDRLVAQVQQKHGLTQASTPETQASPPPQAPDEGVNELIELYGEETVNGE
jgi:hypothetical protein